jgi:hypothetical protein
VTAPLRCADCRGTLDPEDTVRRIVPAVPCDQPDCRGPCKVGCTDCWEAGGCESPCEDCTAEDTEYVCGECHVEGLYRAHRECVARLPGGEDG